jgi:hypothetical protein
MGVAGHIEGMKGVGGGEGRGEGSPTSVIDHTPAVGDTVGSGVGNFVGTEDGASVGTGVGAAVGKNRRVGAI